MVKKERSPTVNLAPHLEETWCSPVAEDRAGLQLGQSCDGWQGALSMEGTLSLQGHVDTARSAQWTTWQLDV